MNPGLAVKLRPTGPWRIGPDSGARNRVDVVYHSDSLFAAVTSAMSRLGHLEEWLNATARSEPPAVCFSSCFPFLDEIGFVIPPKTIWPPASMSARVRWKSARFVPLGIVQAILGGQTLNDKHWMVDGASECLVPAGRPGPFRTVVRWGAAVDRLTGSAERYPTACIEFRPGSGLWALVSFSGDAAQAAWKERVKAAFRLLADSGFGGERSRGWGRSEQPEFIEGTLPEMILSAPVDRTGQKERAVRPSEEAQAVRPSEEAQAVRPSEEAPDATAGIGPDIFPEPPREPPEREPSPVPPVEEPGPDSPPVTEPERPPEPPPPDPEPTLPGPEPEPLPAFSPITELDRAAPESEARLPEPSEAALTAGPQTAALEFRRTEEGDVASETGTPTSDLDGSPETSGASDARPDAEEHGTSTASESSDKNSELNEVLGAGGASETSGDTNDQPALETAPVSETSGGGHGDSDMGESVTAEPPGEFTVAGDAEALPGERHAAGAHWLLSLFTPAPGDTVDWRRGNYSLLSRGGRVESPAGTGELKKQLPMVAEGSVLYAATPPSGSAPDVAPDGFAHPVFRAGFALSIPLSEAR
jgi:CRISPR type III-A-associated RAMP protein Csm4